MKRYELNLILKNLHLTVKNSWNQTRLINYFEAQTHSNEKLELTAISRFPWDEAEETVTKKDTNEEKNKAIELLKMADKIAEKENSNNGKCNNKATIR